MTEDKILEELHGVLEEVERREKIQIMHEGLVDLGETVMQIAVADKLPVGIGVFTVNKTPCVGCGKKHVRITTLNLSDDEAAVALQTASRIIAEQQLEECSGARH